MKAFLITLLSTLSFYSISIYAQEVETITESIGVDEILCPSSDVIGPKMITDVCWQGLFPMYIADVRTVGKAKYAPDNKSNDSVCACGGDLAKGELPKVGITLGMYYPKYLLTVTKKPYCFPELNGLEMASELGLVSRFNIGNQDQSLTSSEDDSNQSSWSWHLASFPVQHMLETFNEFSCDRSGYITYDLIWISETLPHHYDPSLASFLIPETALFASPLALPFLAVDCVASTINEPIDELFFTAGCWGKMYPLTANTGSNPNKVDSKSLMATRAFYFLSRLGVVDRTMGDDALCQARKMPFLKRSQYRFQQFWPMPESKSSESLCTGDAGCGSPSSATSPDIPDSVNIGTSVVKTGNLSANQVESIKIESLNGTCTHPIGQTSFTWGIWRDAKQPDHVSYLVFQWIDCCADVLKYL
jgi:conjugal transfer pilus assembly protein TraU